MEQTSEKKENSKEKPLSIQKEVVHLLLRRWERGWATGKTRRKSSHEIFRLKRGVTGDPGDQGEVLETHISIIERKQKHLRYPVCHQGNSAETCPLKKQQQQGSPAKGRLRMEGLRPKAHQKKKTFFLKRDHPRKNECKRSKEPKKKTNQGKLTITAGEARGDEGQRPIVSDW